MPWPLASAPLALSQTSDGVEITNKTSDDDKQNYVVDKSGEKYPSERNTQDRRRNGLTDDKWAARGS